MDIKILIADDQIAATIATILKEYNGFSFVYALDGRQAVRAAREQPFEVMLIDVRLPGINGVEVIRRIRKFDPATPIIAITGYAEPGLGECLRQAGADDVFIKPFDFELLAARVIELACNRQPAATTPPEVILKKQRRLNRLKEQAALMGLETPAHIRLEIEDLEQELQRSS